MTVSHVHTLNPYLYSPHPMSWPAFIILSCDRLNVGIRYSMAPAKDFGMQGCLPAPWQLNFPIVGMRQVSDNAPLFAEAR